MENSVSFPSGDPPPSPLPPPQTQGLRPPSFRRISLPASSVRPSPPPNFNNRSSVVSVASVESLAEEGPSQALLILTQAENQNSAAMAPPKPKFLKERPSSVGNFARIRRNSSRPNSLRPINEALTARRNKILLELVETEKVYVDALDLIYTHFLKPLMTSLETPNPILSRAELTSIFSNFIDIWNFNHTFYPALTQHLTPMSPSSSTMPLPALSPLLLSHFPYLSLYTPFVTAFGDSMTSLGMLRNSNPTFAAFMKGQETDPRCGRLGLRDWLLRIVQRCPRYILLLKELLSATETIDPEHAALTQAYKLTLKITTALNTALESYSQILSLISLQRATPNLPFPLISPGRSLLKRGSLIKVDRGSEIRNREFLLFTDCLIWMSRGGERESTYTPLPTLEPSTSAISEQSDPGVNAKGKNGPRRPFLARNRSRSETDMPQFKRAATSPVIPMPPPTAPISRSAMGFEPALDEKWWYRGRVQLMDVDVIVPTLPAGSDEKRRFELMSPESSFVLYAESAEERDAWVDEIRSAKSSLLVTLQAMNPNSTLTSSTSTAHLRRALQALPHDPSTPPTDAAGQRRGKVNHFVPAIWVPDGRTNGCMRCSGGFGWRRRRHHCRLCGRVVCANCSGRTFYITENSSENKLSKPARACNACYETVFPILPNSPTTSSIPEHEVLAPIPSSYSMPSLALSAESFATHSSPTYSVIVLPRTTRPQTGTRPSSFNRLSSITSTSASASTPASSSEIHAHAHDPETDDIVSVLQSSGMVTNRFSTPPISISASTSTNLQESETIPVPSTVASSMVSSTMLSSSPTYLTDDRFSIMSSRSRPGPRSVYSDSRIELQQSNDDLPAPLQVPYQRAKRLSILSIPATGLQATAVMTQPKIDGEGRSKRFSLVMGLGGAGKVPASGTVKRTKDRAELAKGVAVGKLSDILGKSKGVVS